MNPSNDTFLKHHLRQGICLALLCLFGVEPSGVGALSTSQDGPLFLSISKTEDLKDYVLELHFTNLTSQSLEFPQAYFPWEPANLMLVAVEATDIASKPIPEFQVPAHSYGAYRSILLKPHQKMDGKTLLISRFPSLVEAVKRNDVVLFWSYQVPPKILPKSDRYGGMLIIPKDKNAQVR